MNRAIFTDQTITVVSNGVAELVQRRAAQSKVSGAKAHCLVGSVMTMAGITEFIDSTTIVQERKQLHDQRIRVDLGNHSQPMHAHLGLVANTMNSLEIEDKPLRYLIDQANYVHYESRSSLGGSVKVHSRVN